MSYINTKNKNILFVFLILFLSVFIVPKTSFADTVTTESNRFESVQNDAPTLLNKLPENSQYLSTGHKGDTTSDFYVTPGGTVYRENVEVIAPIGPGGGGATITTYQKIDDLTRSIYDISVDYEKYDQTALNAAQLQARNSFLTTEQVASKEDALAEQQNRAEQAAQAQAGATADAAAAGRCIWGEASFSPINIHWGNCFSIATYYIASALGLGVGVSANVLEKVTIETVVNMSANISQIGVVDDAWKIFRDFANIAFIFALLYLSIQIILGIGSGHGKMIGRVVVVALLINFSLFFTKVVIDAGNIAALQFYNAITTTPGGQSTDLGSTFVGTLGLQSAFKEIQVGGAGGDNAAQGFAQAQSGIGTGARFALLAGVTVMLLVALFVFFAASIVLLMRFIILVVLMVTAPLAFVAYILPQTEPKAKEWWKKLISETFFVVTFFGILWLVAAVISSGGFKSMLGIVNGADLSNMFTETGDEKGQSIGAIVNFILVIGFLVYALKAGKDLGNGAGEMVNKWGSGLSKWGRGVVGRGAGGAVFGISGKVGRSTLGNVGGLINKGLERRTGFLSTSARKLGQKLEKGSYDFRATSVGKNIASTLNLGEASGTGGIRETEKQSAAKALKYASTLQGSNEKETKELKEQYILKNSRPMFIGSVPFAGATYLRREAGKYAKNKVETTLGDKDKKQKEVNEIMTRIAEENVNRQNTNDPNEISKIDKLIRDYEKDLTKSQKELIKATKEADKLSDIKEHTKGLYEKLEESLKEKK